MWNAGNIVGPMITNKNDKLLQAFNLEPGESWLDSPVSSTAESTSCTNCQMGSKTGKFHSAPNCSGPLLSVACIENLEEGIRLVNGLDYGLTSGLQSLDEKEQKLWKNSVMAGNLYINRGITGAIVNRQTIRRNETIRLGGGIKAGGPNYCTCFLEITDKTGQPDRLPTELCQSLSGRVPKTERRQPAIWRTKTSSAICL